MPMHPSQPPYPSQHPQQSYPFGPGGGVNPSNPTGYYSSGASQPPPPSLPHPPHQQGSYSSSSSSSSYPLPYASPQDGNTVHHPYSMNNPNMPRPMMYAGQGYPSSHLQNTTSSSMMMGQQPQPSFSSLSTHSTTTNTSNSSGGGGSSSSSSQKALPPLVPIGTLSPSHIEAALNYNGLLFGELHVLTTKYPTHKKNPVPIPPEDQKRMQDLRSLLEKRIRALATIADVSLARSNNAPVTTKVRKDAIRTVLDPSGLEKPVQLAVWGSEENITLALENIKNTKCLPLTETIPELFGDSTMVDTSSSTTLESSSGIPGTTDTPKEEESTTTMVTDE